MGIGPSNRSEEACPLMTIDGCQNKNNTEDKKSCKILVTSYTVTPDPTEQVTRHHHCGNKHEPPYGRLMMPFGTGMHIYLTGEVSSSLFFHNFHLHNMLIRVLYNKYRHRYRYLPLDKIPIFSFYITAA